MSVPFPEEGRRDVLGGTGSGERGVGSDEPIEILKRFCAAWEAGDPDALIAFFTEDATYQNMMDDPWHGKETIHEVFRSFFRVTPAINFTIRSIAANGDTVLIERIDICTTTDGVTGHLPLVGVFEVRDGRIAAWRDYYDNAQFRRMLQHPQRDPAKAGDSDLGVTPPGEQN
jgi:limonene-1,2-epoxide hydrolase